MTTAIAGHDEDWQIQIVFEADQVTQLEGCTPLLRDGDWPQWDPHYGPTPTLAEAAAQLLR